MKRTFLIIFLLISGTIFSQSPYTTFPISPTTSEECLGVQFVNANTGYGVIRGQYGVSGAKLAKTTNKGQNWQYSNLTNNVGWTLASISFVDANTGYAYYYNKVSKTTNGGISWVEKDFGSILQFNSDNVIIKFYDANTGYLTFRPSNAPLNFKIFKTNDGGSNWSSVFNYTNAYYSYFIKDIAF